MRTLTRLLAIVALAGAAPTSAEAAPYSATFQLEIGTLTPLVASASGTLAGVSGAQAVASGFSLPASAFNIAVSAPVSPPFSLAGVFFITNLKLTAVNQLGVFAPGAGTAGVSPGGFGGTMPFPGQAVITLTAGGNTLPTAIPLTTTGGGVALGAPGTISHALLGAIGLQIFGAGFTTGTVSILSVPIPGGTAQPTVVTRMGGITTTPGGFAQISLVTPTRITIPATATIPTFGTLTIRILPEPGTLLLWSGPALAALAFLRRRVRA